MCVDLGRLMNWDPRTSGQQVRLRDLPGTQGFTTGNVQDHRGRVLVEIQLGPNDRRRYEYELLELCPDHADPISELLAGRLGTALDLRRLLTLEKLKGGLTNVFYSMESTSADFYPHQFKPVLRFLDSPVGRLLLADEVGLGKTIEAGLIWKEIRAREHSKRLVIVCPSILKEKWQDDLSEKFGIRAEIVNACLLYTSPSPRD